MISTVLERPPRPLLGAGSGPSFSWVAFLLSAVLLVIVVPVVVLNGVPDHGRSTAWRLGLVVLVWSGLRMSYLLGQGRMRFFAFFMWLFTYVFFGVAATIQIRADQIAPTTPDVAANLDGPAFGVILLGLACFEVGTVLAGLWAAGRDESWRDSAEALAATELPVRVSLTRTVALWVVGMGIGAYYVHRMTLGVLFESREAANSARVAIFGGLPVLSSVIALATYPVLVAIGGLTLLRRREPRAEVRAVYMAMSLAGIALLACVVSPVSSARYPLGTVVFALALIFGAGLTPQRIRVLLASVTLGLFFVFPVADAFRRNVPNFARAGFVGEYPGNPDYDAFWQIANTIEYWREGPVQLGRQALGVVLFWVPRSTWPTKPLDTGPLLAHYNGYVFDNLSAPLWAEAMINGGLLAVVGVFVVFGFLATRWDRLVEVSQKTGDLWFVGGAILAAYLLIILRGSLLQATGTLVAALLCVLFARRWFVSPAEIPEPNGRTAPPTARR